MLEVVDAESEHDIPDAADNREGRHPRHEQDSAAPVVAGGPEAEHDFDDATDKLQPPDRDLAPSGDRP